MKKLFALLVVLGLGTYLVGCSVETTTTPSTTPSTPAVDEGMPADPGMPEEGTTPSGEPGDTGTTPPADAPPADSPAPEEGAAAGTGDLNVELDLNVDKAGGDAAPAVEAPAAPEGN